MFPVIYVVPFLFVSFVFVLCCCLFCNCGKRGKVCTSPSKTLVEAAQALLKQKDLRVPDRVLRNFLKEVDRVAPWFMVSGSLTEGSWNKLGKDLAREREAGTLRAGAWPIYKLLKSCIGDEKCREKIKEGQKVLIDHQDSLSEAERGEGTEGDKSQIQKLKGKDKSKCQNPRCAQKPRPPSREGAIGGTGIYPLLDEFKHFTLDSSSDEEEEEEGKRESHEDSDESSESQEEIQTRKGAGKGPTPPYSLGWSPGHEVPSAPPYAEVFGPTPGGGKTTFLSARERRKLNDAYPQAFPVWQDANNQRGHSPLDLKKLKTLVEAVQTYGVSASFTTALIERLATDAMTPEDWYSTIKACLTAGQYLDWKSIYQDLCMTQAKRNANNQRPHWTYDMLTGQGQFVNNQNGYPVEVYQQINDAAVKAWKSLPNKGQVAGNLTKIIQGPTEPFSDFVARMMQAAGRIFDDAEGAMPLIEQLIFENSTRECRAAITPWKGKGITAWMKACREIGGPLSNQGLAAAVLAAQHAAELKCYRCGRKGHMKKDCRGPPMPFSGQPGKTPGLCPRCRKGRHWARECRSVKDIQGKPLQEQAAAQPKNGNRGPRPQGPGQMYGALKGASLSQLQRSVKTPQPGGRPVDPQDWTCVPPPEQY
ncbi:igE-binding protein-like [Nannospalax galili]|uniref:igE-binding protein-like n=1 Tax=Nannospalax galili TaxID=1026970 RepID=UPI000819C18C|nr:igE-binding protein-like [Nannospalax galili]